jgi:hypothetical protein
MMTVSQKQDEVEKIKEENVDLSAEVHKSEKLLLVVAALGKCTTCIPDTFLSQVHVTKDASLQITCRNCNHEVI